MLRTIKWNQQALQQFDAAIFYIEQHSPSSAQKVRRAMLSKINTLMNNSEIYSLDKLKKNNDGSYRAFEIHHYRITYRVRQSEIQIIRIRHTKMNPLKH